MPPQFPRDRVRLEHDLMALTSLPTAAGREQRVIGWVERWAKRRRTVALRRDRYGNLLLQRAGATSRRPIVFAAHMDHPAFVVTAVAEGRHEVEAEFRGGVQAEYFPEAAVLLHHGAAARRGRVAAVVEPGEGRDRRVRVRFDAPGPVEVGDVITWDVPPAYTRDGRLYAPACDDLAGVAAALAAFDVLRRGERDVRVLLTRAEEVGFVGAIAACRARSVPRGARIVALENSKSFADSPLGGGPIVRVGDRTSTFDPDLTYRIGQIAHALAEQDSAFAWQRKLMPGGTCEASAYQALGYTATCLCLPLGHYHNMNEQTRRADAEVISLADYHGLVRLLVAVGQQLDDPAQSPPLTARLAELFERRRGLISPKS